MSWSRTCYGCEHSEDSESEYRCHKDVEIEQLKAENERLKKRVADTEWRYDEPPRDGTMILGAFLSLDCMGPDVILDTACLLEDDEWPEGVWETSDYYHPDCSLLCWQPIDVEV